MSESITPARFHEVGWRVMPYAAGAHFRTRSFAEGVALVGAIGRVSEKAHRPPDVDLRETGVTVRLTVNRQGELSEDDVALAGQISALARELGAPVDLTGLQMFQVAVDALDIPEVMPFWRAVLGYQEFGDIVVDPHFILPVWFQQMDAPRPQRNRIHIDLYLPQDQAEARVAAAVAAGGRIVNDAKAPLWWTLADPEGNEVDVAPWPDRE
jgi:4a-hydroxytetrahydrobiopterin dehydratase